MLAGYTPWPCLVAQRQVKMKWHKAFLTILLSLNQTAPKRKLFMTQSEQLQRSQAAGWRTVRATRWWFGLSYPTCSKRWGTLQCQVPGLALLPATCTAALLLSYHFVPSYKQNICCVFFRCLPSHPSGSHPIPLSHPIIPSERVDSLYYLSESCDLKANFLPDLQSEAFG